MLTMQNKARYGLQMIDMVSASSSSYEDINIGSLYPLLKRLTKQGLLEFAEVLEETDMRRGHRRKYYKLTPLGKTALFEAEDLRQNLRNWTDEEGFEFLTST